MSNFWYVIYIILIAIIIKYHWARRRLYLLSWSLHGSFSLPLVGDALHLMCKNEDILDRLTTSIIASNPSPIKVWIGHKLVVVFTETSHIERVMSSMKFAQKDHFYRFLKPFQGETLISGSGPKWKADRRLIAPMFIDKKVAQYFEICTHQANVLVKILKFEVDQKAFDIEQHIHRCAADIVTESFLGVKPNAQAGNMEIVLDAINRMYVLVHSRMAKLWLQNDFVFNLLGYGKVQDEGKEIVHGFLRKCVDIAKSKHNNNMDDAPYQSIVDQMLFIRDEIGYFPDDIDLVHHFTTLYTASEDTITIVCSFALVMLGMHSEIQQKVADELLEVFGPTPRKVELSDLQKINYLLMCIKDVMRLFPIAPFIMRQANDDCEIDRWTIPKGCSILVSIYNIHRSPLHWERPNEFYPDHFLPETAKNRHPYSFIPFSAGPRGCIGKPFAYMAIKTILATVLQHYRVEADGNLQEKALKADITTRFKDEDYRIRLKKRVY